MPPRGVKKEEKKECSVKEYANDQGVNMKSAEHAVKRGFTLIALAKIRTRGGRGSKNPKILRTSFMYGPLHICLSKTDLYSHGK